MKKRRAGPARQFFWGHRQRSARTPPSRAADSPFGVRRNPHDLWILRNLQLKLMITALVVAGMPMLAQACSPASISPRDALQAPGPTARFTRIVLAEVIGVRAPERGSELAQWREEVRAVAVAQQEEDARTAAQAKIDATTPRGPDDPPPSPPASRMIEPIVPSPFELRTELDLFVLETLYGAHQDRLTVPAGGPCGSQPRMGQQVLVFLLPNGVAHVLERPVRDRSLLFDPAYLDQVRACVRGQCDQTAR